MSTQSFRLGQLNAFTLATKEWSTESTLELLDVVAHRALRNEQFLAGQSKAPSVCYHLEDPGRGKGWEERGTAQCRCLADQ